ncbi:MULTISPECIES: hypothetical protein [Actinomadura]|uniref:hypothetical protein n=1 Tax=Actinomadura sp. NPDC000929 TaxID=3154517 RepID=UPI0033939BB1
MTVVVVQPSAGNPASRRRWADTLGQEVPFTVPEREDHLSPEQRQALLTLHPSGRARFWGAGSFQNGKMKGVQFGDVVLFTGQKKVRGIGEVGVLFDNAAFADTLWTPGEKGSWNNVYSLLSFQATEIPYEEIWALPGFNAGDNFMGLRILDDDKAEAVLQGLGITPSVSLQQDLVREDEVARALAQGTQVVGLENVHTTCTSYQTAGRRVLVQRAEALLVREYTTSLEGCETERLRTPVGITDIHVTGPDGTEIIEAKRGSGHRYVRDALGQLLDYVAHSPEPADRLSGLFPEKPAEVSVALLHRYGVDCLYRQGPGVFERIPAPPAARERMAKIWAGG